MFRARREFGCVLFEYTLFGLGLKGDQQKGSAMLGAPGLDFSPRRTGKESYKPGVPKSPEPEKTNFCSDGPRAQNAGR